MKASGVVEALGFDLAPCVRLAWATFRSCRSWCHQELGPSPGPVVSDISWPGWINHPFLVRDGNNNSRHLDMTAALRFRPKIVA